MLEVNVWYATDDKGVLGSSLRDVTKAFANKGNIGHINLKLDIYGDEPKLKQIAEKYPLKYTKAPRIFKTEKLASNSPYLGRLIDNFYQRGAALSGISISFSFWPTKSVTIPDVIGGFLGKKISIPGDYQPHNHDLIAENYEGNIEKIVHLGPIGKDYIKHTNMRKKALEQMGCFLKNHKTPIANALYNLLDRNDDIFKSTQHRETFESYAKHNKYDLNTSDFDMLLKDVDEVRKTYLSGMHEVETILIQTLLLSISKNNEMSKKEHELISRVKDTLGLTYYPNAQVGFNLFTMRNELLMQKIEDVIVFYENESREIATYIKSLKSLLEKHIDYLNSLDIVTRHIEKFKEDFEDVDVRAKPFIKIIEDLSESINELKIVMMSNEETVGRPADASFTLITDKNINVHYIDEEKVLAFLHEQIHNKDKEDNQYDVVLNNCAHAVKRCIINAIPDHTMAELKKLKDVPGDFFNVSRIDTPRRERKFFQQFSEIEIPGTVENWLHRLNGFIKQLNEQALIETDTFVEELLEEKQFLKKF